MQPSCGCITAGAEMQAVLRVTPEYCSMELWLLRQMRRLGASGIISTFLR